MFLLLALLISCFLLALHQNEQAAPTKINYLCMHTYVCLPAHSKRIIINAYNYVIICYVIIVIAQWYYCIV